jgi:phosphoribosylglycinamide formyltransferase-1
MVKLAVFASGGGTNFQALIDAVNAGQIEASIELLVYDREKAYAKDRALANGIHTEYIGKKRFEDRQNQAAFLVKTLEEFKIDGIILAGFLGIVQLEVVKAYRNRIVNIHPSLIPKYCGKGFYGLKVHEAVIEAGDNMTGVTVHYVDEGIDTGKIIAQEKVAVIKEDTAETLQGRVLKVEHQLLVRTVQSLIKEWK